MAYCATVRYGKMLLIGKFRRDKEDLRKNDRCVVRTDRGKELGQLVTTLEAIPEDSPADGMGDILRRATPEDEKTAEKLNKENRVREIAFFKEQAEQLKLPMKLLEVDHLYGGERVVFYFASATRVDFRELVRRLAHEYRTRIELKQIGARDQARLVGDVGHCGLGLCCRSHLKELGGITMDMAKIQKHTADPSKITGRCGKLLCCLRYEYYSYVEARDMLPPRGTDVVTRRGAGRVVSQNLLLREVTIEAANGDRTVVRVDELEGAPQRTAGCTGCEKGETLVKPLDDSAVRRRIEQDTLVRSVSQDPPTFQKVAKLKDVPPGKTLAVTVNQQSVALVNLGGRIHALQGECPHQGGPLGEGTVEGEAIVCPLHKWKFDINSGTYLSVGQGRLTKFPVRVQGDDVLVKA